MLLGAVDPAASLFVKGSGDKESILGDAPTETCACALLRHEGPVFVALVFDVFDLSVVAITLLGRLTLALTCRLAKINDE